MMQKRRTLPPVEVELDVPQLGSASGSSCGTSQGSCTAATRAAEADCIKELYSKLSSKCPFCHAVSPKLKKYVPTCGCQPTHNSRGYC